MATRILVPLDGSPLAEQALPYAMALGHGLPAELLLLRTVSIPSDAQELLSEVGLSEEELKEKSDAEASEYLNGIATRLQQVGLSVQQVVQHGPAAEAIVDYAIQANARQIVMATHGYTGIKRWTHGSVAERVLHGSSVPVLLVRAQEEVSVPQQPVSCQRILVPLDGSDVAEQVLSSATVVAQALGAEMILFQVPIIYASGSLMGEWFLPLEGVFETAQQNAQAYLDRVSTHLRKQRINVSTATRIGPVAESIIEHAEANDIDLIAMCTHGRTGLARWTLGSVADRVLRGGSIPILLVRAR